MKNYLTTGEFASLCGVKKDTVFHYDEINLLKPDYVAENGYRYYSPKQVMVFKIISALKGIGMSLKEIQYYSAKQNSEEFLCLLNEKRAEILEKQQELAQAKKVVDDTIEIVQTSLVTTLDEVIIVACEEEYMATVETPPEDDMNERTYWSAIKELSECCSRFNVGNVFPIGEIVKKDKFLAGEFRPEYYCSKPIRKVKSKSLLVKPAGKYAIIYVQGSYKHLGSAYEKLRCYIEDNKLLVTSDVFQQDLVYQFSNTNSGDYLMRISVGIS